jgi:crotonobetainyl-CoA:carnitine CoA-transferase CaiB-like acyl-CoA transferase
MFTDLKVLELASVLAGPSVGQFFAELGAEVIKVENLKTGGDITRSWKSAGEQTDDRSAYFCSVNWGKKSVAIDLSTKEGKEVVRKLAAKSDVIIASYKPGDAEKLGVSYQQLRTNNPSLIYGQITGYGSDNDRVGYDAVLQAETGFMDLNGEKDGPPTKMPVALIDVLAAHHLKEGLLLALLKKEKTGAGSLVEVSLVQAAISSLVNQASNWLVAKKLPTRQGSSHPNIAPYGDSFVTADGKRILLAIGSDRQFQDLCNVLGIGHVALQDEFTTNQKRVENRVKLNDILTIEIQKQESEKLLINIHARKIPAGLVQNVKEALEMKEAYELVLHGPDLIGVRNFVGRGFSDGTHTILPPPHFGEHTNEILESIEE